MSETVRCRKGQQFWGCRCTSSWYIFSLLTSYYPLKHYLDLTKLTLFSLNVSRSFYCFTYSISHGIDNYFPRLWGTGISSVIFLLLNCLVLIIYGCSLTCYILISILKVSWCLYCFTLCLMVFNAISLGFVLQVSLMLFHHFLATWVRNIWEIMCKDCMHIVFILCKLIRALIFLNLFIYVKNIYTNYTLFWLANFLICAILQCIKIALSTQEMVRNIAILSCFSIIWVILINAGIIKQNFILCRFFLPFSVFLESHEYLEIF